MSRRPPEGAKPKLSICIATFKRAAFIGQTLDSILGQLEPGVEVVVVDGASPDDTAEVVSRYAANHPALHYHREEANSGVDADYDKAVGYARGDYCWLMSDDDVLVPGAIARVLSSLADGPDLVVVNAESRTPDLLQVVDPRLLAKTEDRDYTAQEWERFFVEVGLYLSYIGAVVVRREAWMARARSPYYGSLFIHVGVIFQHPPMASARVLSQPLIQIRWGNAMWSPRSLEVWMFKWAGLVWSFGQFSASSRAAVCPREPWRNLRMLGLHRALGGYSTSVYQQHLSHLGDRPYRLLARAVAVVPTAVANVLATAYCVLVARGARRELYDLAHGANSTWVARLAARWRGL